MTAAVVVPALCLLAVRWVGSAREPHPEVAR
jgi:hypothetical protein